MLRYRDAVRGLIAAGVLLLTVMATVVGSLGFDLSNAIIPREEVLSGGPPKDGIPALLEPKFIPAQEAGLSEKDRVLGIAIGGEAKAYPIRILNWHEIVNDTIGGRRVVITYCPLCGTGIAFDATIEGKPLTFGVSGLLYKSDLLMYDHQTESLWSQIPGKAISGKMAGKTLSMIPLTYTTWGEWLKGHPETEVLSERTGFFRNYRRDPYSGYEESRETFFPVGLIDLRFHPKEWVLGVEIGGMAKAYPFSRLIQGPRTVGDRVGGREIVVHFNPEARSAKVTDRSGREIPSVTAFWFAWSVFHPNTEVFQ